MTTMNSNERERLKRRRSKRLEKIRQALSTVEDRLVITAAGVRSDAFRALYYLERLAKKAK